MFLDAAAASRGLSPKYVAQTFMRNQAAVLMKLSAGGSQQQFGMDNSNNNSAAATANQQRQMMEEARDETCRDFFKKLQKMEILEEVVGVPGEESK